MALESIFSTYKHYNFTSNSISINNVFNFLPRFAKNMFFECMYMSFMSLYMSFLVTFVA